MCTGKSNILSKYEILCIFSRTLFHLMKILCNKKLFLCILGNLLWQILPKLSPYTKLFWKISWILWSFAFWGNSSSFEVFFTFYFSKLWKVFVYKKLCNGKDDVKVVIRKLRSLKFTFRPFPALDKKKTLWHYNFFSKFAFDISIKKT